MDFDDPRLTAHEFPDPSKIERFLFRHYVASAKQVSLPWGWDLMLDPSPVAQASMLLPSSPSSEDGEWQLKFPTVDKSQGSVTKPAVSHVHTKMVTPAEVDYWLKDVIKRFVSCGKVVTIQVGPSSCLYPAPNILLPALSRLKAQWADAILPRRQIWGTDTSNLFNVLRLRPPRVPLDSQNFNKPCWTVQSTRTPSDAWMALWRGINRLETVESDWRPSSSEDFGRHRNQDFWAYIMSGEGVANKLFIEAVALPKWDRKSTDSNDPSTIAIIHITLHPDFDFCAFHTIHVIKEWRRKGVAKSMLKKVLDWIFEMRPTGAAVFAPVSCETNETCEAVCTLVKAKYLYEQRWIQLLDTAM